MSIIVVIGICKALMIESPRIKAKVPFKMTDIVKTKLLIL